MAAGLGTRGEAQARPQGLRPEHRDACSGRAVWLVMGMGQRDETAPRLGEQDGVTGFAAV